LIRVSQFQNGPSQKMYFSIWYLWIKNIMAKNKRKPRNFTKSKKSIKKTMKLMNNNREVMKKCIESQL
jgi:hypothetical protein